MNLVTKFNDLEYNKQKHKFHDSLIEKIEINCEKQEIRLNIEFCRYLNNKAGEILELIFLFKNTSNIIIENPNLKFGTDIFIGSFEATCEKGITYFKLIGINGWSLCFSAIEFECQEIIKEIDNNC